MKLSILFIGFFVAVCRGENRIAGGHLTTVNAYPYATALLTNSGAGTAFRQACGGTILTSNAILSAASCFYTNLAAHSVNWWRARVGSSYSNSGGTIHILSRIITNPGFQPATLDNDIAVLRTRFDIVLQPGVTERAFLAGSAHPLDTNQQVVAIGWGAISTSDGWSDQLRQVQFWVVNQQTCLSRYSELGFTVTPNMVCAGWLDVGVRGQCEGDVGSPLLSNGVVVGVFSRTQGCADYWYPDINTRVPVHSNWIVSTATAA